MKNMRVLIDTNVIMDFIIEREPFTTDAEKLIGMCLEKHIPCCIAAHTVPNLFYILRKHLSDEDRRDILLQICKMFVVVGVDSDKLESALQNYEFKDFEDCLQSECAKEFQADFIVTRNVKDFGISDIPAIEPTMLMIKLEEC